MRLARIGTVALVAMAAGIAYWGGLDRAPFGSIAPAAARSEDRSSAPVNFRAFHDRLAPYGRWTNHRRWGAVWRPNAGRGFRPYRDGGHWENTDEYGTVWVSDYGWGDVPFHYGRWVYDPDEGWIWVPGYVWAPAWVIWRAGAGNVGWLPMPPWLNYDGFGVFPDDWSNGYGYADNGFSEDGFDDLWSFVDADDLYAPGIGYYVIGPRYYRGFIGRTVGWTRFSIYNGHVANRSIDRDRFHAAFGHDPREGRTHDFAGRLGPVVDYASGRAIEAHERGVAHALTATPVKTIGPQYEFRTTPPSYSAHSVNMYRGGPSPVGVTVHRAAISSYDRRVSPAYRGTPTARPTVHRTAPAYHPAPLFRSAPHGSPSGNGKPRQ